MLGDAVNLAARLEGQSKNYGVNIVIGDETAKAATEFATLEMDFIAVKGKTEGVHIFCLLGRPEMKASSEFNALVPVHDEMIAAYRGMGFPRAEDLLAQVRELAKPLMGEGLEVLYDLYTERLEEYKTNPPPADWDGVFVATSK